ncbi:MAG: hypothetical protein ABIP80_06420 [Ferruginibacter sp.]
MCHQKTFENILSFPDGYASPVFQGNYDGYIHDLIVFSHEEGHAV